MLWKDFWELKKIMLEAELCNGSKTVIKNPWASWFWEVPSLLDNFFSKMLFLNAQKIIKSMGSEYSLRRDLKTSRHFLFYRFEANQMY
jgi:hypothetical protein